jgi:hypothetical protein
MHTDGLHQSTPDRDRSVFTGAPDHTVVSSSRLLWCAPDGATAAILRDFGLEAGTADPDKLDNYRGAVVVVVPPDDSADGIMAGAVTARRLLGIAAKVSRGPSAEDFMLAARSGADPLTWQNIAGAAELPPWTPEEAEAAALDAQEQSKEDRALDLALAADRELTTAEEPEPWEDPISFDAPLSLPEIQLEAMPATVAPYLSEVAKAYEVHADLPAAVALGALAIPCQKRYRVHVAGEHYEPMNLFVVAGEPPGERKSPVFAEVMEPVADFEEWLRNDVSADVREAQAKHAIAAERRKKLHHVAAGGADHEKRAEATAELIDLERTTPEDPPSMPMLTVGADITAEALASKLSQQGGKIAIVDAEGGRLFSNAAGHYTAGSGNFEALLAGHAGDTLKIHRKGSRDIVVKHPAVTVVLAIQPDVVRSFPSSFKERGLEARHLYVFPKPMAGRRKYEQQAIRPEVREAYRKTIETMFRLPAGKDEAGQPVPHILRFAADAYELHRDLSRALDREMAPGGALSEMKGWASKAPGAAARIAGILHVAEHAAEIVLSVLSVPIGEKSHIRTFSSTSVLSSTSREHRTVRTEIPIQTVARAWKIVSVLKEHARHAYALMGADADGEFSRDVLAWLRDRRPLSEKQDSGLKFDAAGRVVEFSQRALHRRFRTQGKGRGTALRALEERLYIRLLPKVSRRGQQSPRFEVNPLWTR